MPKVTRTTARKDSPKACPEAKAGQVYYWWRKRMKGQKEGVTRCSLTYPKQSQLTSSDFWGAVYDLQESMSGPFETSEDLIGARDGWADEARDIGQEQQDKFDNMPDGLQQGDTGILLEERAQACNDWADEIEAVDIPSEDDFDNDDDFLNALADAATEIESLGPECS